MPGLSDHEIIMIEYRIKPLLIEQTNRKIPLYDEADWQSVADGLQSLERHVSRMSSENVDVEHLWKQFHDCIQNLVYTCIAHKTSKSAVIYCG